MPDTYGTEEMFQLTGGEHTTTKSRTQRPRASAYARCPRHYDNAAKTALDLSGKHLVWREHEVVTWGKDRRPCRTPGTAVCEQPPKQGQIVECPCGASHGAA